MQRREVAQLIRRQEPHLHRMVETGLNAPAVLTMAVDASDHLVLTIKSQHRERKHYISVMQLLNLNSETALTSLLVDNLRAMIDEYIQHAEKPTFSYIPLYADRGGIISFQPAYEGQLPDMSARSVEEFSALVSGAMYTAFLVAVREGWRPARENFSPPSPEESPPPPPATYTAAPQPSDSVTDFLNFVLPPPTLQLTKKD